MASTARTVVVTQVKALLDTWIAANPTLLRQCWRSRPAKVAETPFAFIGGRNEALRHDSGTRDRTFTIQVVLVDTLTDNIESGDRIDPLVDLLVDLFTANPHAVSATTVIEPVGVEDVEIEYPPVIYRASAISLRFIESLGRN